MGWEILLGFACAVLLMVFIVQIGKARELASAVRNDDNEQYEVNRTQAMLGMVFVVVFLASCVWGFVYYTPYILGWGPNTAASEHGPDIDYMFNLTLFFTSIVFFITQFLLYYFGWKFRGQKGRKAVYWAHNEKLEMVWMIIPAIVMTFLVVGGLQSWNTIMSDEKPDIEIEARGMQFAWLLRYPGRDGQLGETDFRKINDATGNPFGQDWTDKRNMDDFLPDKIVLPVGKKVRVRITARDVLHNFYIRDMRVKMDAIPGMPTHFTFTPVITTDSMRRRLSQLEEWNVPDKNNPDKKRWETFDYELACAELCGRGHYSMRRIVQIVTQEEYEAWLDEQEGVCADDGSGAKTQYMTSIRYKAGAADPFVGLPLDLTKILVEKRKVLAQYELVKTAYDAEKAKTGSSTLPTLQKAMDEFKPVLSKIRTTNDVVEAVNAVREAERITQQMGMGTTTTSDTTTTTVTDTTAVNQ